ncbi:hypothetical protein MVEN_00224000 [Mycena venus]|uniref:F-box domain-containing protein n=1 Tax=Mycena venus TaxID=2733690 RepID=A0A8H6Z333_9AGAR|nr:hypothetical protein MVEN_00224000 [Mycena venus]
MTIELPAELIDAILDHLARDFTSLKACSLVCRAWVVRSRSHLFETCSLAPNNIIGFCSLLHSCTFLHHIHSLDLFREVPHQNDHWFSDIDSLCRLTGIRVLQMTAKFVDASTLEQTFFSTKFLTAFPNVTHLVFSGLAHNALRQQLVPLLDMICQFPALQDLHIRRISPHLLFSATTAIPPRELCYLTLCTHSVGPILAWLHAAGHLRHVRSLKLPSMWHHEVPFANAAFGSTLNLHCLDIPLTWLLPPVQWRYAASPFFDLSLHLNLHTLILRDSTYPDDMMQALTRLDAPSLLECLAFALDLPSYRCFQWAALDAFLACPTRFPRLRNVVFIQTINYTVPKEDAFVRRVLPLLKSSGILHTKWLRLFET